MLSLKDLISIMIKAKWHFLLTYLTTEKHNGSRWVKEGDGERGNGQISPSCGIQELGDRGEGGTVLSAPPTLTPPIVARHKGSTPIWP